LFSHSWRLWKPPRRFGRPNAQTSAIAIAFLPGQSTPARLLSYPENRRFRHGLLNVFPVAVPPLRERREDIPLLTRFFIQKYARKLNRTIEEIPSATLEALSRYDWPGNIRELQNVIERAVILCDRETFTIDKSWMQRNMTAVPASPVRLTAELFNRERDMIETALMESRGRISGPSGAAVKLGIPRTTLESRITSLHINKHSFREQPWESRA
jgi:formate hydrogenlyase transcriptional activator